MTVKWHGGKGSQYRPVDKAKFEDNWDKIFGNKEKDNEQSRKGLGNDGTDGSQRSSGVPSDRDD